MTHLKREHQDCREALDRADECETEARDRFLSTPSLTTSGVLCKLRAAGDWIRRMKGSNPRDVEDRLALSALADLERLVGEVQS